MSSSQVILVTGRKRIADFGNGSDSPEKQPRISSPHVIKLGHDSDLSSCSGSDLEEDANEAGKQTPLTPLSSRDWPSLRKTIKCTFPGCDKTFNRQAKLRDHLRYHTGERPFTCTHAGCQSSFPRKTHLDRHIKSAHTDVRDYTCSHPGCGKAFSTGTRLRRHETSHEKRSQFKCDECGQEFRKHGTLQKHKDTDHRGLKAFVCDSLLDDGSVCNAGFDRATALNSHKTRVHGPPRYECTICRLSAEDKNESLSFPCFSTYSELQNHNLSEHPPTCPECGKTCLTSKELNRHMELQHGVLPASKDEVTGGSLFVCPIEGCGRSFTKNGNLKVHVQSVHVQSRPFVCGSVDPLTLNGVAGWNGHGACFRDFKAKCQLEEHIRTVHMGLESRHKARRQAKQTDDISLKVDPLTAERDDAISRLTGAMYDQHPHRKIACLITGCSFLMTRDYDLDVHLRSRHGLDDEEIQIARANGMRTEFGSQDPEHVVYDEASLAEEQEDSFWVGSSRAELNHTGNNGSWDAVQDEMDMLIGEGHGWEDDIIVDPSLL